MQTFSFSIPLAQSQAACIASEGYSGLLKTKSKRPHRQKLAEVTWPLACQIPGTEPGEGLVLHSWFGKQLTGQKKSSGLTWHGMNTWALS